MIIDSSYCFLPMHSCRDICTMELRDKTPVTHTSIRTNACLYAPQSGSQKVNSHMVANASHYPCRFLSQPQWSSMPTKCVICWVKISKAPPLHPKDTLCLTPDPWPLSSATCLLPLCPSESDWWYQASRPLCCERSALATGLCSPLWLRD